MSIEAMKQALEALKKDSPWREETITSLRQAIEQAEKQEPVAWGVPNTRITERQPFMMLLHSTEGCQYPEMLVPLYTTPQPQREWVGLTDEEIALVCAECAASAHNWNDISFAHAIEAKLKDKNHVS